MRSGSGNNTRSKKLRTHAGEERYRKRTAIGDRSYWLPQLSKHIGFDVPDGDEAGKKGAAYFPKGRQRARGRVLTRGE